MPMEKYQDRNSIELTDRKMIFYAIQFLEYLIKQISSLNTSRSASAYELISVKMTSTCFPHS
jgi:hypothetical protein